MDEIADAVTALSGRWAVGGSALDAAPAGWRAASEGDADPDLALLALSAQALSVGFRPAPGEALPTPAALPRLAAPMLPEALRGRFRRLMASLKPDAEDAGLILTLIAARGHVVHPLDWMPKGPAEGVPEVYGPWLDWRAGATEASREAAEVLDAETWDAFFPSERRLAFAAMRRSDPEAARVLLAEKAADVPAEERLRLVDLLRVGLSEADAEVLRGFATDRSGKVRALAGSLLARLDLDEADEAPAAELAAFFAKGGRFRLPGSAQVAPVKAKNDAQRRRRTELCEIVSLARLARALDMDRMRFVETIDLRDARAVVDIVSIVTRSGMDEEAARLAGRLVRDAARTGTHVFMPLVERLSSEAREGLIEPRLVEDDAMLAMLVHCRRHCLGVLDAASLRGMPVMTAFSNRIEALAKQQYGGTTDRLVALGLFRLGLLASPAAARDLIDRFTGAGLGSADPALAMLSLNAALTETAR